MSHQNTGLSGSHGLEIFDLSQTDEIESLFQRSDVRRQQTVITEDGDEVSVSFIALGHLIQSPSLEAALDDLADVILRDFLQPTG